MTFKHFLTSANESNAFVVACDATREAILIDVGAFESAIAEYLDASGLRLVSVFITHDHYDHTGGLSEIVRRYGSRVFAGRSSVSGCRAVQVEQGSEVRVGEGVGIALDTSGHTRDGRSLYFAGPRSDVAGMVFTGDALFAGSVGGTGSAAEARGQIRRIRESIFALPRDTEIHPGHGPSSTVAIERRYNPFFV